MNKSKMPRFLAHPVRPLIILASFRKVGPNLRQIGLNAILSDLN